MWAGGCVHTEGSAPRGGGRGGVGYRIGFRGRRCSGFLQTWEGRAPAGVPLRMVRPGATSDEGLTEPFCHALPSPLPAALPLPSPVEQVDDDGQQGSHHGGHHPGQEHGDDALAVGEVWLAVRPAEAQGVGQQLRKWHLWWRVAQPSVMWRRKAWGNSRGCWGAGSRAEGPCGGRAARKHRHSPCDRGKEVWGQDGVCRTCHGARGYSYSPHDGLSTTVHQAEAQHSADCAAGEGGVAGQLLGCSAL